MYQVIKLHGDFEPWWFLEDWKDDIVDEWQFSNFQDAQKRFCELWQELHASFPLFESRENFLAAFWDSEEQRWCDECDESMQQYHSIMLLSDDQILSENFHRPELKQANAKPGMPSTCALTK